MADPFLGEIDVVAHNFPPKNWAQCDGAQLPIAQNQALFSLLGTQFGGNGVTTFALPDLRGRVPLHWGTGPQGNVVIGQSGGEVGHTLSATEMAAHGHPLVGAPSPNASSRAIAANVYGLAIDPSNSAAVNLYTTAGATTALDPSTVGPTGSNQPHPNMQPYLAVNFIIALAGVYPSRN